MRFSIELTEEEMSVVLDALANHMLHCAEYHCEEEFLFTEDLDGRLRKAVVDTKNAESARVEDRSEGGER